MNASRIKSIVKKGEGISLEFKECKSALSKNVYETVCAFLNRTGGELLLGVADNGTITGVDQSLVEQVRKDFITSVNNPLKISPSFYLSIETVLVDGKAVLYIYIPESSQVHRCNGKIFDRNEDGDCNITDNHALVSNLYIQKQMNYSENKIFPYAKLVDLKGDWSYVSANLRRCNATTIHGYR